MSEPIPPFEGRTKDEFDEWAYRHRVWESSAGITLPPDQYDALADDVLLALLASYAYNGFPVPRPDRLPHSRLVVCGVPVHRGEP